MTHLLSALFWFRYNHFVLPCFSAADPIINVLSGLCLGGSEHGIFPQRFDFSVNFEKFARFNLEGHTELLKA